MNKFILIGTCICVSFSFSCQNLLKEESFGKSEVASTETINSNHTPKKNVDKELSKKHYWEGLRLKDSYDEADSNLKAIEEFQKAAEFDGEDTMSYWQMAEIYYKLKNYSKVEECYREIIKRNPQELRAQWALAQVLVENLGKYEEGVKELTIAKNKKATYSFAIEKLLGKAYEELGDNSKAITHYKAYLKDYRAFSGDEDKEIRQKVSDLEKAISNNN